MAVRGAHVESLSPELALVDPRLAANARAQLPPADGGDMVAFLEHDPSASTEDARAAALRRISRVAELEEFPDELPRLRVPKVGMAITTWSTAVTLVAYVRLYDWSTWPL